MLLVVAKFIAWHGMDNTYMCGREYNAMTSKPGWWYSGLGNGNYDAKHPPLTPHML